LDADLLDVALSQLAAGDAQLSFARDKETGLFLVSGLSEDHLAKAITGLRDSGSPAFTVGAPQVAYREQLGCAARIEYVHKRLLGPMGEFAVVVMDFEPAEAGAGFKFENKATDPIPREFIPAIEKGLRIARQNGVRAGFPLIDFTATLIRAAYHDVDSSPRAFQIAAQGAVRELRDKGDVRIVEPVMDVEIVSPEEFVGAIISDLNSRRCVLRDQSADGDVALLKAEAPLANMFGYTNALNFISQGCASYTMQFSEYRVVPLPGDDPRFPPAIGMRA
jgi:elongation factor G